MASSGIFIGPKHQAEIPSVLKKSKRLSLGMNPAADSEVMHQGRSTGFPVSVAWSDADSKSFLIALFIFGKNFIQIKTFLENKKMVEILAFYYGNFHTTDGYRRWSECKRLKGRQCLIGKKLFTKPRQRELLSRLIPHVSQESQDTLSQVCKSYMEGITSLEEYISSLKFTVGLGILVEVVGIGKEKEDLTRFGVKPGKKNNQRAFSAPTCKDLSSLGPSDIIQSLTGSRLSKTKSNELFWKAVWPRLLARGWHSEKPKDRGYTTSKDYIIFLIPDVEKFSRRELVKGDGYFDSVSDVLSKVVAEPNILKREDEEEAEVGSFNEEETEKASNEDDLSHDPRQCYLEPKMLIGSENKITKTDDRMTNKKEAHDNPDKDGNKMVKSRKYQHACDDDFFGTTC